jgi:hypothetical protein
VRISPLIHVDEDLATRVKRMRDTHESLDKPLKWRRALSLR